MVLEIPKPLPSKLEKTVEPVQPQMETKPVIAETKMIPKCEPVNLPRLKSGRKIKEKLK
jgi:hypothetical protein